MRFSVHDVSVAIWLLLTLTQAGFIYDNSVILQTDDAGHVGAAVSVHVACVVDLQTNDVLRN